MGDFDPSFVHALATQSWSLYAVGMFLILLRIYARVHRLGFKGLQIDDYLMMLAGALYTTLVVCLNVISSGGGSNLYLPDEFDTFTPQDIQERIKGSKIVLVSEQAMLNVIYTIKACMLLMYSRLTLGLNVQRMVFYLAIYVACGWVATEIAFFTACTPFQGYWAMPPPDPQCTTLQHYAIIQACFNISSDSLMLLIPIPLITRLNMPWKQKGVLLIIFSMGTFVILAAILTKVFNLSNIWDPSYMLWYTREASVAVYVSNLPMIWPLLREWFPSLRSFSPGQKPSGSNGPNYGTGRSGSRIPASFGGKRFSESGIITTIRGKGDSKGESTEELSSSDGTSMGAITRRESWEMETPITRSDNKGPAGWDPELGKGKGGIHMSTTVHVSEIHVKDQELQRLKAARNSRQDLEKGNGAFDWDFKKGGGRA